jgi:alcohol dehydrogenase class IV
MLPVVLDHLVANSPERHPRLVAIAEAITGRGGIDDPSAASKALRELIEHLGLPTRLRDVGVRRESFEEIAEASMGDLVVGFSPVSVSQREIVSLLEAAY